MEQENCLSIREYIFQFHFKITVHQNIISIFRRFLLKFNSDAFGKISLFNFLPLLQIVQSYNFIEILGKMSGLKNLIPKAALGEDNCLILKRKSQEYRKNIGILITHLEQISKNYGDYYSIFEQNLAVLSSQIQPVEEAMPKFYSEIIVIFKCINKQFRKFIEKTHSIQQTLLSLNDLFSIDYNLLIQTFQQHAREYFVSEQISMEISRRYFKLSKQMLTNIQAYKDSFMDVKLIYNKDERVKRYNQCATTYKTAEEDLASISARVTELNYFKNKLISSYQILEQQLVSFIITSVFKYIDQLKKFYQLLSQFQQNKMQNVADKTFALDKLVINNLFTSAINLKYQQLIACQIDQKACEKTPCFLLYHSNLTEEGRSLFAKMLVGYSNQISGRADKRKVINKKLYEYVQKYIKALDKYLIDSYKETLNNFQKMRKKIGDVFGNRWKIFYKMITSIFENNIQNTSRLIKKIEIKLKSIESSINQSSVHMDNFLKEMKQFLQKVVSKKKLRKFSEKQQTIQSPSPTKQSKEQKMITSQQLKQQSQFMMNLIQKYNDNLEKSDDVIKTTFIGIISDIKTSMIEFQSYCNEMDKTCYQEEYQKNYKLCQDDINDSLKKEMKFFEQIMPFAVILKDNQKITFQSDFYKIEGFKKIKKPKQLEEILKDNKRSQAPFNWQSIRQLNQESNETRSEVITQTEEMDKSPTKFVSKDTIVESSKNLSKRNQFLSKKIQFGQNEKYVKSFSCGLVDKIILSGKIFITTDRICFHSNFNAKNLFGQTFIQIPKSDIKKIQKRSALFFNNSIAITTVNGQMIFTSFFSRDTAYGILIKTFQISSQGLFFEEEDQQDLEEQDEGQMQFEDDMKEETQKAREQTLTKKMSTYNYAIVNESQFVFSGLTVIKFLRLFDLDQEIKINRTSYPSFSYYFKDLNQHKQITIPPWTPNPLDFLNTLALKESIPEVFTRRVSAIVPLPSSGIPFMPKTSLTVEDHSLFIISKNKFVLESIIKNNGIPYCDSFDIRIKRTVESLQENKIQMKTEVFVNFNQSILVKSTIESKTIEQSQINMEQHASEIKNYLRILEKKMLKSNKKQGPQDKGNDQSQMIQQLESQITDLRKQNKKCHNDCIELSAANSKKQNIIIILAVIMVMEFLLLLR